jgi:hypothetical protein
MYCSIYSCLGNGSSCVAHGTGGPTFRLTVLPIFWLRSWISPEPLLSQFGQVSSSAYQHIFIFLAYNIAIEVKEILCVIHYLQLFSVQTYCFSAKFTLQTTVNIITGFKTLLRTVAYKY